MSKILTPDQRLRVFVSSTMKELAEERVATRAAIDEIHMMPVMFGLGARAHPPRNLYRAYIDQSHVFVGIYWQEYGWIAPGMDVSGVEDEYILSADMPKLIYIKEPAPERSDELVSLLDRIRNDDRVSYKSFSDATELRALVSDDLAILLTERFYSAGTETAEETQENPRSASLPIQPTRFIGRAAEIDTVTSLLQRDDVKLVTLVGPGGIGKSRLAIEVGRNLEDHFNDGLRFVPLAPLTDADRLFTYLVSALELKENVAEAETALANWLSSKEVLLILDNFEQLLDAADEVADLLEHATRSKILVTSRAVLRIRGEHECAVPPLSLPRDVEGRIARSDAIALFKERALEVRPDLVIEGPDIAIVAEICRRLDGLPLAIELGAARMKVLTPQQLLERLSDRLSLLTGGARDLPERQQTLRATIDWSYQLLNDEERELFARLAVFRRGATLDAIEEVCAAGTGLDVLEGVASLVEKSLLRQELAPTGEARFWMLETIREFAAELLHDLPERDELRTRHASYYERLCHEAERGTLGREQRLWMDKVDEDYANILDASNFIFASDNVDGPRRLAQMLWDLVLYAWVRNRLGDARRAAELLLEVPDLPDEARAHALAAGGAAAFWQGDIGIAIPLVVQGRELFDKLGDRRGVGTTLLVLGMVAPEIEGPEAAKEKLVHALSLFEELGDEAWLSIGFTAYCWTLMLMDEYAGVESVYERSVKLSGDLGAELTHAMSLGNLGMLRRWQERYSEAIELHLDALRRLIATGHDAAVTYTLVNSAETLIPMGEPETAAQLLGARDRIHAHLNVLDLSLTKKRRERVEQELREILGDEAFETALATGGSLTPNQAMALLVSKLPAEAR
jgi:predicted ATPase